jgi:hypothetical protein
MSRARAGEATPIGLTEPRPGVFLIGLPTFDPNGDGVKAYQALYAELDRRHAALRRARAIVLDLRFNNGGASEWSQEIARRLWGKEAVDRRMEKYFRPVRIWWRASPGNVAYMADMETKIRHNGQAAVADQVHATAAGMKAALDAGRDFYVEGTEKGSAPRGSMPATDLKTPIYAITWGACASACMDALDTFKRFSNVKLIGSPTSADSTYMDVRVADLPSGQGRIVIPLKIWMHRPRGAGVIYRPDIEMDALDWSTSAFLDRIERNVALHH